MEIDGKMSNKISAKRTATEANISPLSNNSSNNENSNSPYFLIDSQVSLVKATLTTINTLIPTLTTEQTPILLNFIKTLTEQFDLLSKSIDSLKEKQQEKPYGYFSGAKNLNTISAEELERERSIVVTGLKESTKKLPSEKMADDSVAITSLLDSVGVECAPRFFYRMGRQSNPPNNGHARLLKIVLPSRKFQRELLKKWKTTGKKSFPQINMRESMTPEQLQRRKELIEECKRKRMENPQLDWIVYGDAVILRSEVHIFRKNKNI